MLTSEFIERLNTETRKRILSKAKEAFGVEPNPETLDSLILKSPTASEAYNSTRDIVFNEVMCGCYERLIEVCREEFKRDVNNQEHFYTKGDTIAHLVFMCRNLMDAHTSADQSSSFYQGLQRFFDRWNKSEFNVKKDDNLPITKPHTLERDIEIFKNSMAYGMTSGELRCWMDDLLRTQYWFTINRRGDARIKVAYPCGKLTQAKMNWDKVIDDEGELMDRYEIVEYNTYSAWKEAVEA